MTEEPNNDFWWGCKNLLESIQGTYIILEHIHELLKEHTNLPIPTILQKHVLNGRKYVSVEKLTGSTPNPL